MRVFVVGSGSTGNAVLVESAAGNAGTTGITGMTRVLLDAGVGPSALALRLSTLGVPLTHEVETPRRRAARGGGRVTLRGIDAIVATHHHGDHFGQIERLARATAAPLYLHDGIAAPRVRERYEVRAYVPRRAFRIGRLVIEAEPVPHDAPQVALRVADERHAFGVATDVGRVTSGLVRLLASCDGALLEANHCPELLAFGPYPPRLKERVRGGLGHLSNDEAADLARRLVGTRLGRLWLGHLSHTNNTPERALAAVRPVARGIRVAVVPHGETATLEIAAARPAQLALPLC